jgi:hypothetical protein
MRRLSFISSLTLLCILFAFVTSAFASEDSEGWTSLRSDVYINMKSMASRYGSTVSLWVKVVPDEDSELLLETRQQFKNKGRDDKALAYHYSGVLTEIDCSTNNHRELITILYDANKNILHSANNPKASWTTISAESRFDLVQRAVCEKLRPFASHQYEGDGIRSGC